MRYGSCKSNVCEGMYSCLLCICRVLHGSYIVATNKGGNTIHVFKLNENSEGCSLKFE